MLEFILGGAGTGKTSLVYERIQKDIADKRRVILLVPEQETVAREREMTEILPPSAQLHFEVLNFTRLANSFFREHGGLTYHYVTPSVKALAMWNTVRTLSPLLSEYGRQKNDPSFGNMMLSQIEEFKAYSVSPAALERAAEKAETGSRMRAKLSDLALIYSAYTASLDTYGAGDSSDDVGKLAELLSGKNYFKDTRVYIDSFTSFTGAEESVIRHMIKECDRVTAAFTLCDVSCGLQFEGINRAYRRLLRIAERCGTAVTETVLTENHRTKDAALLRLSKDIWRFDAETESKNDSPVNSVSLIKCTNVYEEAEAVSTYVTRLVQSGMRYRDIVILARNTESYSGIIDNALEKAKIPYFMSKKEDITSMPLAKLILCAFRIKNGGYRLEDVISYIKTGLCGIEDRMADLFEQYIWKWNINGLAYLGDDFTMDPDSYSSDPDEKGTALLSIINEARRAVIKPLAELFGKIDTSETNADICRALFEYMEKLHIYEQMKKFASDSLLRGETAEADSAARLYNSILDALSTLAEFDCGEKRYDSDEFETALRIVLSETSLGNIPTSCDEVTFGSASLFRASSPRCVILIGVNDGVFPANTEKARVLGDEDKQFLLENGIELSGGEEEKASEELFYVYRAVSAPSEKLIMTYAASELQGGKELRTSLAFERARLLLSLPVIDYSALTLSERLWQKNIALEYVGTAKGDELDALSRYFSEDGELAPKFEALYIPITDTACRVPKELSELVFGDKMSFSPSALEKYVRCHFDYWCEYVLHLKKDERNIFRLNDTGSLIHALLEKFIALVTDEDGFNAERAEEEGEELIKELMSLYVKDNFPEKDIGRESTAHVISKLCHLTSLMAKNITKELKKSRFVPTFFELKINERGDGAARPLTFTLSDGSKASLRGIVDRVDIYRDGKDAYVKVVDYKTGSKEFSERDIRDGLNMQMLIYLFSICESEENKKLLGVKNGSLIPSGVVYLSSRVSGITEKSGTEKSDIDKLAEAKLSRSGILLGDEKVLSAVNEDMDFGFILSSAKTDKKKKELFKTSSEMEELRALVSSVLTDKFEELRCGEASAAPMEHDGRLPCEYCSMKPICRAVHRGNKEEGEVEN